MPRGRRPLHLPGRVTRPGRLRRSSPGSAGRGRIEVVPAGRPAGDQIVILKLVLPPADSDEKKALYRRMAEAMPFDPRAGLGG